MDGMEWNGEEGVWQKTKRVERERKATLCLRFSRRGSAPSRRRGSSSSEQVGRH